MYPKKLPTKEVDSIQVIIAIEGFQEVVATLMGFDRVLLSNTSSEGVRRVLESNKNWWNIRFSIIKFGILTTSP
jgi:hypothetical protein